MLPNSAQQGNKAVTLISNACIDAKFCGFKVTTENGKIRKIPLKPNGQPGISKDDEEFIPWDGQLPPNATHWGVVLQKPTWDTFGQYVLTCLDLDSKNSTEPDDVRFGRLVGVADKYGFMVEDSHSGRGKHIVFLAEPDPTLQPKVYIQDNQEIEIFGHANSHGKSVMLTGINLRGHVIEKIGVNVRDIMIEAGINPDAKPPKTESQSESKSLPLKRLTSLSEDMERVRSALNHITLSKGDYDRWTQIGMAIQSEFGDAGFVIYDEWSSRQYDYEGSDSLARKWKSFDESGGITLGTLFHEAKDAGWNPPARQQLERTAAAQDFAAFINKAVDPQTGEILEDKIEWAKEELFWKPLELDLGTIRGTDYLIDGFLADSFSVFAGQPGAGKTTAMIPLALTAAGFPIGDLRSKDARKIIYVSEDPAQVRRILFSYCKFEDVDPVKLASMFTLIEAKRVGAGLLSRLRENVLLDTLGDLRPWLILDTASATMSIRDENDNSGVAEFVAALKEDIFLGLKAPVNILAHMAKAINRNDEDGMARGASAWEGDATLTGTLFVEDDIRYLKLRKTRYEPDYREIRFETKFNNIAGTDSKGRMQDIHLLWTIPKMSDSDIRKEEKEERKRDEINQRMQNTLDEAHTELLRHAGQFSNPVIQVGAGRAKPPDGAEVISLDDWLRDSGIQGTGKTDVRKELVMKLRRMIAGDQKSGFVNIKNLSPKG